MVKIIKSENNIITENRGIIQLLNALSRYYSARKAKNTRKKVLGIRLEKVAKIENISKNELNQAEKLQKKSIDELREIARLRRTKNREKLAREDLIISLLRSSESSALENISNSNNNDNTDDDDDDTYDGKRRDKMSDIIMILSGLRNAVTNKDKKKVRRKLCEIEKKESLSDKEKEKIYDDLIELVRTLDKKEEYKYHDRDDLDYHGIGDIVNLFDNVNDDDYYKPILVKSFFKENCKYYESKG